MATSLIKLRQLDQTELSGYIQQFQAGVPTSSGASFSQNIIPSVSGLYTLGNTGNYWQTLYSNSIYLPSGSGITFGNQTFVPSGNALVISGPSGSTIISSTTNYVTYVGPQGPVGATGASGAKITGASADVNYNVTFFLNDGSSTNPISLPSGAVGPSGYAGPSGASVTGSITGTNSSGQYFKFLYSNGATGIPIYVPSGVQGADGEVGGVTLYFQNLTGLFTGQSSPIVSVAGLSGTYVGGPDINLIKGFSYKFNFSGINSLLYEPTNATTNFIAYGDNDAGYYSAYDGSQLVNGLGNPLINLGNSGALLLTLFASTTPLGRYLWKENGAATTGIVSSGLLIDPTTVFENYAYVPENLIVGSNSYNFYWKTEGTVRFSDSVQSNYKYGFALYNADSLQNPPVLQDSEAFYVLGNLNLAYAPLAGPQGPTGPQGIPGPAGVSGPSGSVGATGIGVSGVTTNIVGGILNGFQIVLTNGQVVGPYLIPTGGPVGPSGAVGPAGSQGTSGISVTGVNQLNSTGINFALSNNTTTNPVILPVGPQGPSGLADKYYSYFDPAVLNISGLVNYTGFQTGIDGVNWKNATGNARSQLSTGMYVKIFGSPTLPFANRTYSTSQNLVFAQRGQPSNYFGAQVVSFDGSNLTFYVTPQVGYWTYNGLTILGSNGNLVDVNLGSLNATGPTGTSVTGVSGYYNGSSQTTGIKFLFSDTTSSQVFPLPVGPQGPAGTTQAFRTTYITGNSDTTNPILVGYAGADFVNMDLAGSAAGFISINSGTVTGTGQVVMLMVRNSGYAGGTVDFVPENQFYFVNNIKPAFPSDNLSFNIYTFLKGIDYNSHPVYYCTYAANYPVLS
jgi:collagen type VII alpha